LASVAHGLGGAGRQVVDVQRGAVACADSRGCPLVPRASGVGLASRRCLILLRAALVAGGSGSVEAPLADSGSTARVAVQERRADTNAHGALVIPLATSGIRRVRRSLASRLGRVAVTAILLALTLVIDKTLRVCLAGHSGRVVAGPSSARGTNVLTAVDGIASRGAEPRLAHAVEAAGAPGRPLAGRVGKALGGSRVHARLQVALVESSVPYTAGVGIARGGGTVWAVNLHARGVGDGTRSGRLPRAVPTEAAAIGIVRDAVVDTALGTQRVGVPCASRAGHTGILGRGSADGLSARACRWDGAALGGALSRVAAVLRANGILTETHTSRRRVAEVALDGIVNQLAVGARVTGLEQLLWDIHAVQVAATAIGALEHTCGVPLAVRVGLAQRLWHTRAWQDDLLRHAGVGREVRVEHLITVAQVVQEHGLKGVNLNALDVLRRRVVDEVLEGDGGAVAAFEGNTDNGDVLTGEHLTCGAVDVRHRVCGDDDNVLLTARGSRQKARCLGDSIIHSHLRGGIHLAREVLEVADQLLQVTTELAIRAVTALVLVVTGLDKCESHIARGGHGSTGGGATEGGTRQEVLEGAGDGGEGVVLSTHGLNHALGTVNDHNNIHVVVAGDVAAIHTAAGGRVPEALRLQVAVARRGEVAAAGSSAGTVDHGAAVGDGAGAHRGRGAGIDVAGSGRGGEAPHAARALHAQNLGAQGTASVLLARIAHKGAALISNAQGRGRVLLADIVTAGVGACADTIAHDTTSRGQASRL